jgi:hypothetical protein
MEPKKYWWIRVSWSENFKEYSDDTVTDIHPFIKIDMMFEENHSYRLLDWKLISAEEYNLFNEINQQ